MNKQILLKIYSILAFVLGAFSLYTATMGLFTAVIQRGFCLMLVLVLGFLGLINKDEREGLNWNKISNVFLIILSVAAGLYIILGYESFVNRAGANLSIDIIISGVLLLVLFMSVKRIIGLPLFIIAAAFILYGIVGPYIPRPFGHAGYSMERIMPYLSLGTDGILGTSMGVAATVIIIYSLFGSFLEEFGVGEYFIKVAYGMVGRSKGGSAKASIIASGLMGMVSGSSVANVLTTGNFTLPLMIRTGYSKMTAAAVLAVAAAGGLIMPPVMGAGAFVMSEMRGLPYSSIAIAAIIPAVLYFASLFIVAGLEADKVGMKVLSREELPKLKEALSDIHLSLPLLLLFFMLIVLRHPPSQTAMFAIGLTVILAFFRERTRPNFSKVYNAIAKGADSVVSTAITCAAAGIIVGMISLTGLGVKISALILTLSGNSTFLALFFAMVIALILGMGMPPVAAYIILASMIVPSMVKIGIDQLSADMFVFFFSCIGNITPPVALTAFATAGMVGEDPFKTGFLAFKIGVVAFIIPYAFVYGPSLLMQGSIPEAIFSTVTALIGVYAISVAVSGWYKHKVPMLLRLVFAAGAISMIISGIVTDIAGIVLIAGAFVFLRFKSKEKAVETTVG